MVLVLAAGLALGRDRRDALSAVERLAAVEEPAVGAPPLCGRVPFLGEAPAEVLDQQILDLTADLAGPGVHPGQARLRHVHAVERVA
ncbi:hypothetical protein SMCF_42 [Streptomyces coelicoflavus ZG0656]|nr:hypothetical protein SMCF_42 [Streptomyces coelicoflavus ZG0656]MZE45779.1 hypothetical protein [Streptomyces sp. SID5477]